MYQDVSEVRKRIEELESEISDITAEGDTEADLSYYTEQVDHLTDAISGLDSEQGLIHENDFEDEARTLAEDIDGVDVDRWPYYYINWERAAGELMQDYSIVEIEGETYYYR